MPRHHLKKSITVPRNYSNKVKTIYPWEAWIMHGTNEVQVIVISFSFHLCVPIKRYTNRFVMHVSKGKQNVNINT